MPLSGRGGRASLLGPFPPEQRRPGPGGSDYALQSRLLDLDPLNQREAWEVRATRWRGAELVEEDHRLTVNLYFAGELVMMLERAGFIVVEVRGECNDLPATPDDRYLVYVATRG